MTTTPANTVIGSVVDLDVFAGLPVLPLRLDRTFAQERVRLAADASAVAALDVIVSRMGARS